MLALGFAGRRTNDIDVLEPVLDSKLLEAAKSVAIHFHLPENWLNNGPRELLIHLRADWRAHTETVFQGNIISVKSIGRRDLLISK